MDPFIELSLCIEPSMSSPSKTYSNTNKEFGPSDETSFLVIGGEEVKREEDYANYQSKGNEVSKSMIISTGTEKDCFTPPMTNSHLRSDKPETSSNSTTFTVAPSVSSSSSSAPSSVAPLSPVNRSFDLRSPSSLHESTISRLIDAVSLGNEQDTCGSISALIGQFESTIDQDDHTALSHVPSPLPEDLRSPLKTNTASPTKKPLTSPRKVVQKTNHATYEIDSPRKMSPGNAPTSTLFSSPETSELEEVYTILDEEVLLPVSVYNLRKQTVHVQADTMDSTPSSSLGSSPTKVAHRSDKMPNISVGWDGHRRRDQCEDIEESIYEEVYDPPAQDNSKRYAHSSINQFVHHPAGNAFNEVEINVDEDPLDMLLTSPRHGSQWEGPLSPTKRHAIYQNHESTPNYSQQQQHSSYHDPKQQFPLHAFSPCPSPMHQPSYQQSSNHQHLSHSHNPSPFHRNINSQPLKPSPLHQSSYSAPQSNSEPVNNNRDFISSYRQHGCYTGSQNLSRSFQDRLGYKQMEREQERSFHNGFSSSDSLPLQSTVSANACRGLYSPSTDSEAVYSLPDYECFTPPSEPSVPQSIQPHCQSPTKSYTPTKSWDKKTSLINRHQPQPDSRVSLSSNLGPFSLKSQSNTIESTAPSPCKSKSLGDLTSEDISCNFQGKYHIISRSFITPHMRKQKRFGTMGEVTLQSQSCDPLTEQLRKLVSLEGDDSDSNRDRSQTPQLCQDAKFPQPEETSIASVVPRHIDDSPPLLTRRLSSRSQSRVRHINSRARERQQEALKPRAGAMVNSTTSIGGVVLRNKPASQNPPVNRHSTGSYIAGYFGQLEDRGLPEGACTSLRYGKGDQYGDRYYTDDSLPTADSNPSASEPEVYFLLRL